MTRQFKPFNAEKSRQLKKKALEKLDAEIAAEQLKAQKLGTSTSAGTRPIPGEPKKEPALRKMEEVETERAAKAQEEIKKINWEKEAEIKTEPIKLEKEEEPIELVDLVEIEETPELERLRQEVEKTRSAYVKKDYELTNAFANLKVFFGKILKTTRENIPDTNDLYGNYRAALNGYLNARIEALKSSKIDPSELKREMGELVKFFNQDEKIELFDSRTKARAEYLEDKLGKGVGRPVGWVMNIAKKFFHWYEKSEGKGITGRLKGMSKRTSVNAALTGLGLVATAMPAVGLSFGVAKRVLAGTAIGVGTTRFLEGHYRKKEGERMTQEREEIIKNVETFGNPEDIFNRLIEKMNLEMDGYKDDIQRELKGALKRKTIGLSVGVIAAVVLPEVFRYLGEKTGATELIREKVLHYFGSAEIPTGAGEKIVPSQENLIPGAAATSPENIPAPETPPAAEAPMEKTVEVSKNIDLTVEKDSSFQGSIIKYLTEHGIEKGEAGKMAHRMWDDFADKYADPATKDYSLIQPGAKVEISLDADGHYKVVGFQDSKLGSDWIGDSHKLVVPGVEATDKIIPEGLPEDMKEELLESGKGAKAVLTSETPVEAITAAATGGGAVSGAAVAGIGVSRAIKFAKKEKAKVINLAEKIKEKGEIKISEKKKKKTLEKLEKNYGLKSGGNFDSSAGRILEMLKKGDKSKSENVKWRDIKGKVMNDILGSEKLEKSKNVKMLKDLEKNLIMIMGNKAKHSESETVMHWLARNIDDFVTPEKVEQKIAA